MNIKENNIIKFSLIVFIITILLIFYIENNFEKPKTKISEIELKDINKRVIFYGNLTKFNKNNDMGFFTFEDNNKSINIVTFNLNQSFELNKTYKINGRVNLYENNIQVIADEISLINQI